ncbi:MAG: exodeoxyribonuclease VII small subunit [Opitutae bacterium]
MVTDQNPEEFDFEQSLRSLETLVSESEKGNVTLEDMVNNYQQGIRIVANCRKRLELAELQIKEASNHKSTPSHEDA